MFDVDASVLAAFDMSRFRPVKQCHYIYIYISDISIYQGLDGLRSVTISNISICQGFFLVLMLRSITIDDIYINALTGLCITITGISIHPVSCLRVGVKECHYKRYFDMSSFRRVYKKYHYRRYSDISTLFRRVG